MTPKQYQLHADHCNTCVIFGCYGYSGSRNSSVSLVTRLRSGRTGVWFPAPVRVFCPRHRVQAGSGAHPPSYIMGSGGRVISPGIKFFVYEADHSQTSSAEIKNAWSYSCTPYMS